VSAEAEKVDTVPVQQLKRYVDLLSVESADNYEKWMKVGLILFKYNNSKSSYELFKAFSKKSSKYDAHYCKLKWNSFANKQYDRITLGTLKSYARSDNKEEYDKLECVGEALHFETLDIDQQYIMSKTKQLKKLTQHFEEWYTCENKMLAIRSAYNTGKTQTLKHLIATYEPKKILLVTCRQSLAYNLQGNFTEEGAENYLDGSYKAPRLICSLESLQKLIKRDVFKRRWVIPYFDMVVLDESESLLAHFESNTLGNKMSSFVTFDAILKKCGKVVALDGDFGNRSYDYLKTVNREQDFVVIRNAYVPAVRDWQFTADVDGFEEAIEADLENKQRVFLCCMSSERALRLKEEFSDHKVLLHYSKSHDALKTQLKNVNDLWTEYEMVIITPTVEAGVDFNVKEHFDKLYVVLSLGSTSQRGLLQMCNRVRNLRSTEVKVLLNGLNYRTSANLYSYDEVEAMFQSELQHNDSFVTDENGDLIEKDSVFQVVRKYNYLEAMHKNPAYFVLYLIQLLRTKGQTFSYDDSQIKKPKKVVNITQQNILNAKDVTHCELTVLIEKQESNVATSEEKYQIERYMYKNDWGIKELDEKSLAKCFHRTHILYNNRAINNMESKPYKSVDEEYADVDLKIKKKKLEYVNELLQVLTFKDEENAFTGETLDAKQLQKLQKKVMTKCKLFTDSNVQLLFGFKKQSTKSVKSFLRFINSVFANYGIKIASKKTRSKGTRVITYVVEQEDFKRATVEAEEDDDESV
jgi:hypothetical protein